MPINEKYRVLGVMSGTSLDGIDLAICTFTKDTNWKFKIEKSETLEYTYYWKKTLSELHTRSESFISEINIEYGKLLAETINIFLAEEKIDFIASHGHTILHQPKNNITLQIGDGETMANITKTKIINNFRSLDVSLNGQGAPLVPIGDLHLFSEYKYCVNLGGFANISIKENNTIIAFDICPVNIVMNAISKRLKLEFDMNGNLAKKGKIIPELLEELNNLPFYKRKPPKSLAREWVEEFINPLLTATYKNEDLLNTFCEHVGMQIGKLLDCNSAFFTGGGVFNTYLMSRISHYSKAEVIIPNKETSNFKEALIFGFLGVLRLRNEVNCLQSVTGAKEDNCGGEINNPM
ncbi:MAG: anhydro-N-acetylmuramic acid kinase [Flavobacteriales bacterium]|nr:anhydro-N-acetylmuramic acid kinase [Flavobacteriales bacterium]|tara:strand:+ start:1217 stop:2266 length:1050 start_codon:yes stop_codon:yes gene_type:complete